MTNTFETEADIRTLAALDGKDTIYIDTKGTGLRIRVSARTGRKVFAVEYRPPGASSPTKRKLGPVGKLSLKDARLKAQAVTIAVSKGTDPLEPECKDTVADLAGRYKAIKHPSREDQRIIDKRILPTFGSRRLMSIKTIDATNWHASFTKTVKVRDERGKVTGTKQEPAPHAADRALDTFKAMMNWAEAQELKPKHSNPCENVARNFSPLETERHFEWSDDQIAKLAAKLTEYEEVAREGESMGLTGVVLRDDAGRIVSHYPSLWTIYAYRFLILTGVRKSEALTLRWDQMPDGKGYIVWLKYKARAKKKDPRPMYRAITGPLAELMAKLRALRIVGNPYVFVGANRASHLSEIDGVWDRIREEAGFYVDTAAGRKGARIHDLRHLYGDEAADAGLNEKQIMALMGHSSTMVSRRYSKGRFRAHAANAEIVAGILAGKLA